MGAREGFEIRLAGWLRCVLGGSPLEVVANYIRHQDDHHRKHTFQDEYLALLDAEGVAFDPRYLW